MAQSRDFSARRDALAAAWEQALRQALPDHACPPTLHADLHALSARVVAALGAAPPDVAAWRTIGAALAGLCRGEPRALGATRTAVCTWVTTAFAAAPPAPVLARLLQALAAGFLCTCAAWPGAPAGAACPPVPPCPTRRAGGRAAPANSPVAAWPPLMLGLFARDGTLQALTGPGVSWLPVAAARLIGAPAAALIADPVFLADLDRALAGADVLGQTSLGVCQVTIQYLPLRDARRAQTGVAAIAQVAPGEPPPAAGQPALSVRERQVLQLVAEGWTNTAIGAALAISGKTVEKHIRAIYDKLGVSARVAAAHWWWSVGGRDGAE